MGGRWACPTEQAASYERVQEAGGEQRRGVEEDEVGEVVGEVLVARESERADVDGAAVRQTPWTRGRQQQPRHAVPVHIVT